MNSNFPVNHDLGYSGLSVWKYVIVSKGDDKKCLFIKVFHNFLSFCFGGQPKFQIFHLTYCSNPGEWRWGNLNYGGDRGCGDKVMDWTMAGMEWSSRQEPRTGKYCREWFLVLKDKLMHIKIFKSLFEQKSVWMGQL